MSEARRRWILVAMCAAVGVVVLDESAVAVVLTAIRRELDLDPATANWVLTAYLLSLAATVAAFGRLADLIGLRTVAVGGALVFGSTSIGAGLAESPSSLIAFRVAQGMGAAALFPAATGIVRATTPPDHLGAALGYFGLSTALGLMVGPLLGGFLAEWFSWRLVFFLSVPVVIFVVAVVWIALPELAWPEASADSRFDWVGLALLVALLTAGIGGLMQGPAWGWSSGRTLAALGTGGLGALLFVIREKGQPHAVIDIDLFRKPTFLSANLTTLFAQFAKTAVIVYGPSYLIDVLGFGTFAAGLALMPGIVIGFGTGPATGRLVDRIGARRPLLGALCALSVALFALSFAVTRDAYVWWVPGLMIWGYGCVAMFACSRRAAQGAVPPHQAGQVSGINSTSQWLGAALSVPILGAFVHGQPHYALLYVAAGVLAVGATLQAWALLERPTSATS